MGKLPLLRKFIVFNVRQAIMRRGFSKTGVVKDICPKDYSCLIEAIERHFVADDGANRRANSKHVRNYILDDLRIGFGYDPSKDGQLFYWMFGDNEHELVLLERAINNKETAIYLN